MHTIAEAQQRDFTYFARNTGQHIKDHHRKQRSQCDPRLQIVVPFISQGNKKLRRQQQEERREMDIRGCLTIVQKRNILIRQEETGEIGKERRYGKPAPECHPPAGIHSIEKDRQVIS